jgi:photosystem II stability/assembly factor-like uncharacterized protein
MSNKDLYLEHLSVVEIPAFTAGWKTVVFMLLSIIIILPNQIRAQWVQTNGPFGYGSVTCLAVSGSNIFAGTNQGNVFLSTDCGASWQNASGEGDSAISGTIVISLITGGSNVIAGVDSVIYLSANDGSSWGKTFGVNPGFGFVYSFATIGTRLFASTLVGLQLSTDQGATWQKGNAPGEIKSVISAGSALVVVSMDSFGDDYLYRSTDLGATWQDISPPDAIPGAYNGYHLLGSGPNISGGYNLFVTFLGKFEVSTNCGTTWQVSDSGLTTTNLLSMTPWGTDAFVGSSQGGVFLSTDNGTNWNSVSNGLSNTNIYCLATISNGSGGNYIVAGTDTGVWRRPISEMIPLNPAQERWRLISLPGVVNDNSASALYSDALSSAYSYSGSYIAADMLQIGKGYWLKFPDSIQIPITGDTISTDTINVTEGWNLIGSITTPVPVSSITSNPPGMVTTQLFGYGKNYLISDTIEPGRGYWVKTSTTGQIILGAQSASARSQTSRIRCLLVDTPPAPPSDRQPAPASRTVPSKYLLSQNYPNPFNPTTTIRYALPSSGYTSLVVYDMLGVRVATLVEGMQTAGFKSIMFSATNLASGVYFYRLQAGSYSATKTLVLIK